MNPFPRRRANSESGPSLGPRLGYAPAPAPFPPIGGYADPRSVPRTFHSGLGVGGPTGGFNGPIPMFPGGYAHPSMANTWGYSPPMYVPQPFVTSDDEDDPAENEALEGISPLLADLSYSIYRTNPYADTLQWDVRQPPSKARNNEFPHLPEEVKHSKAVEPRTSRIKIYCKELPWSFTVKAASPLHGVTIGNVLETIYEELQTPLTEPEYFMATEEARKRMFKSYIAAITEGVPTGRSKRRKEDGVKRVDYLGNKTIFQGLHRGDQNEEWLKERTFQTATPGDVYVLRLTPP